MHDWAAELSNCNAKNVAFCLVAGSSFSPWSVTLWLNTPSGPLKVFYLTEYFMFPLLRCHSAFSRVSSRSIHAVIVWTTFQKQGNTFLWLAQMQGGRGGEWGMAVGVGGGSEGRWGVGDLIIQREIALVTGSAITALPLTVLVVSVLANTPQSVPLDWHFVPPLPVLFTVPKLSQHHSKCHQPLQWTVHWNPS